MSARRGVEGALLLALLSGLFPERASAYEIDSPVTAPCHEELAVAAWLELAREKPDLVPALVLPDDALWREFAADRFAELTLEPAAREQLDDDELAFIAFSLLVGARKPDIHGSAVTDANALRRIHGDPSEAGQYPHCLRSADDDGSEGDLAALDGAAAYVRERTDAAAELSSRLDAEQVGPEPLYVDFHGRVEVELWLPGVALGEALHTVADAYSHTLRTDDATFITSVLNYAEAADGTLDEARDGLAHSRALDDCDHPDLARLRERAAASSRAMLEAGLLALGGELEPLERGLSDCDATPEPSCGWFGYLPACLAAEPRAEAQACCSPVGQDCESPWLEPLRSEPSAPLCSVEQGRSPRGGAGLGWAVALGLLAALRRLRLGRLAGPLALAALLAIPRPASAGPPAPETPPTAEGGLHAGTHLAAELHGALLADASHGGLADVAFGAALRAGRRSAPSQRGLTLGWHVLLEHDAWVGTEPSLALSAGALNFGGGLELGYFGGLRSVASLGLSVLLEGTPLVGAPSVGPFFELRPLGLLLPVGRDLALSLEPLGLAVEAPALGDPSLVVTRFRLVVGLEWRVARPRAQDRAASSCL